MDPGLFLEILGIDSTSGSERRLAEFLAERLPGPVEGFPERAKCQVLKFEVGDGTENLLLDWSGTGKPSFVFCTHLDTVPPYIPPTVVPLQKGDALPEEVLRVFRSGEAPEGGAARDGEEAARSGEAGRVTRDDVLIRGRGSCDAKGQLFAMYTACRELEAMGRKDFGLLLLAGEETGSFGAKAYSRDCPGGDFVLVGEPTDNCLVTAGKGTKAFGVTIHGRPCHSGYPEQGESAVEKFVDFMNMLAAVEFPVDPVLGPTTWNVGKLSSDNPQNVLSPEVRFRLYFRTTFASDTLIRKALEGICPAGTEVEAFGGDEPLEYFSAVGGIASKPVAFGSDAPGLVKFARRAICGPGSILTAHTAGEYVLLSDLEQAVRQDVAIFLEATGRQRTASKKRETSFQNSV